MDGQFNFAPCIFVLMKEIGHYFPSESFFVRIDSKKDQNKKYKGWNQYWNPNFFT